MIKLNKNQINYGDLKSRKKLVVQRAKQIGNNHCGLEAATIVEKP